MVLLIPEFCRGGPETDLRTDSPPPTRCALWADLELLIAYMWPYGLKIDISTSVFSTIGTEIVENLKISPGKRVPSPKKRIKRQQTVSSARRKVLAQNPGILLAWTPFCSRFIPIECSYSQSVTPGQNSGISSTQAVPGYEGRPMRKAEAKSRRKLYLKSVSL